MQQNELLSTFIILLLAHFDKKKMNFGFILQITKMQSFFTGAGPLPHAKWLHFTQNGLITNKNFL